MDFTVVDPTDVSWITRPHEPGQPARHVRELSEPAGLADVRANIWRYEAGSKGKRHRHFTQEESYLVIEGTLSIYVGEPPERHDVETGSLIRVGATTPRQAANHGDGDLVLYVTGFPPEDVNAEVLDDAV